MISNTDFKSAIFDGYHEIISLPPTPRVFTLSIKKKFDGFSLIDVFSQSFSHVDQAFWENKIHTGNLTLDGKKVPPNQVVRAGQITQHSSPYKPEPPINYALELIHATNEFWIINKPSPLPVHAGGRYLNHTLKKLLETSFPKQQFHLINRLDANTTGLVLVALNKNAAQNLNQQFQNQSVTKTYLALVEGIPVQDRFSSTKSIGKEKTPAGGRKIESGKDSFTEFKIRTKLDHKTLLEVTPHSGRTNQIRLHLADMGFPIVGDLGYKNPEYFDKKPLTYDEDTLYLHSWKLKFKSPLSQNEIEFEAPTNEKWSPYV